MLNFKILNLAMIRISLKTQKCKLIDNHVTSSLTKTSCSYNKRLSVCVLFVAHVVEVLISEDYLYKNSASNTDLSPWKKPRTHSSLKPEYICS